ncbi:hypothetical protein [Acinetobacter wuhouensis]|uniref:Molybdenum ABC transporter substrate-binding protein n=1 Tax=Acinetobacter wuhouensis TaxID=1879050 RepID=A0A4Q7ADV0_9GAMM|nr:hypothetical protein [Acinetobacter wuhouensis]RZG44071.1 hypothetical protein EXU28_15960 [Acinetobacter wuhouensis]
MKKSGLIFMLLAGVAVMSTACTSSETTKAPETTQTAPTSVDQQQSAQTSTVDPTQQGTAVEGDANIQQSQAPQATDDTGLEQQPSVQ